MCKPPKPFHPTKLPLFPSTLIPHTAFPQQLVSTPMATLNLSLISKTLINPISKPLNPISKPSSFITPLINSQSLIKPILKNSNRVKTHLTKAAVDGDYSSRRSSSSEPRETIMLPGCDYNHWLIVMEFPKDPAPTREQMIDTYLNTLATVLGCMEEAKQNMYAFSTTTYTGFQCTVSEETSEKFKGLPGVLWVLPDSYIDVKNKDYGGDKYVNGEIIPCQYPTYQPKPRKQSKYESKKYVRQRDGPPAEQKRPKQEAASSESPST